MGESARVKNGYARVEMLVLKSGVAPANQTKEPKKGPKTRQRVNGVGRGGGQTDFNRILTRFHGIRLKSVKVRLKSIRLKSGRNPLKSCVSEGTARTLAGSKR